ncbi:MAG: general secretion pathway protein GspK [Planctomycetaceae bacterium]|nr:general secretion pathway protein GspK [Planctomycetaceae bacterium]
MQRIAPHLLSRRRRGRRGIALLITLVVMIIYLIIANHYIYTATVYARIANNQRDEVSAYWLARGGIYRGRAQIALDDQFEYDSVGEGWAGKVDYRVEGDDKLFGQTGNDFPGGAEVDVRVSDEAGKFNILLLLYDPPLQTPKPGETADDILTREKIADIYKRLIQIVRRKDERLVVVDEYGNEEKIYSSMEAGDIDVDKVTKGVIDYLEADEFDQGDVATFNAEKEAVVNIKKQSPYKLLTLNELLNAEEMSRELLYGPDQNILRHQDEPEEEPEKTDIDKHPATGKPLSPKERHLYELERERAKGEKMTSQSRDPLPLVDYLTIWGDGKININTAPLEILLAFSPSLDHTMATEIIEARDRGAKAISNEEENESPPDFEEETDEGEGEKDEEDDFAFLDAHIASAVAFYNRIKTNPADPEDTGGGAQSVADFDNPDWEKVYKELKPFLTTRSRFFTVESSAKIDKITKRFRAVFRRDAGTASASSGGGAGAGGGSAPGSSAPSPSAPSEDVQLPPEPSARLTLIFLDEEE